jgi:Zn-dependent protease with chaperone function
MAEGRGKMEHAEVERTVARLERSSAQQPALYQLKVALFAALGFGLLALILAGAFGVLLLLVGLVVAAAFAGWGALLVLLKFGKLLLLLALPLWFVGKATASALFTRVPPPQGLPITRERAPALFVALDDMRRRMKGPRFHRVLLTDELNAAVVQRPLFGLFGWPRNYLLVGLPLLDCVAPGEALAVVAHEYGHLAGSHSRFGAFIYRLRLTWSVIQHVSQQWNGWGGRLLGRAVAWYAPHFNAYTFVLARANEYAADAAAARLVGAAAAASALKRVNLGAAYYERFMERTFEAIGDAPKPPADLSMRWAGVAANPPTDDAQRWLQAALERRAQLADTHPVLRDRLDALGEAAADVVPCALPGTTAAQAWLAGSLPELREALQHQWLARISEPWQARHEAIRQQRGRLDVLRGMAEPSVAEHLERLQLELRLHPGGEHGPVLAAFNATHADHAGGLFLQGEWQLAHGDEAGLALMERAAALDAEAIKPMCERAHAFFKQRNDTRADLYEQRWNERQGLENECARQRRQIEPSHELLAPTLPGASIDQVKALLQTHGKGVAQAWLARRVLPADPSVQTYVLGLRLTWWAARRGRGGAIVERLAANEWPMHMLLFALDGTCKPVEKRLRAVDGVFEWQPGGGDEKSPR